FRVVATNQTGTTRGSDATFTTVPLPAPGVVTGAADALSRTGAVLHGSVDPSGLATTYHFEYGPTASYGSRTADAQTATATDREDVAATLADLAPGTTYHYHLVAQNSTGTTVGDDQTLTTVPLPAPDVSAVTASATDCVSASLGGRVDPNGLATSAHFEYGP